MCSKKMVHRYTVVTHSQSFKKKDCSNLLGLGKYRGLDCSFHILECKSMPFRMIPCWKYWVPYRVEMVDKRFPVTYQYLRMVLYCVYAVCPSYPFSLSLSLEPIGNLKARQLSVVEIDIVFRSWNLFFCLNYWSFPWKSLFICCIGTLSVFPQMIWEFGCG